MGGNGGNFRLGIAHPINLPVLHGTSKPRVRYSRLSSGDQLAFSLRWAAEERALFTLMQLLALGKCFGAGLPGHRRRPSASLTRELVCLGMHGMAWIPRRQKLRTRCFNTSTSNVAGGKGFKGFDLSSSNIREWPVI
ncbi:hypothetical protein EDB92DRAFT_1816658 [Lactarius akahatsu]|uniref:Uncharacterized protein n=1 Tax=Lactarius akahatsu TaxID=416441 RepID=A0AAD4LGN4_9AGAM|nr:hypothetical protein EDB92DRAFT_1816658 [Lactarius akahatsu]